MEHTAHPIRLHGTLTSPYVRRVRLVAAELELPVELIPPDPASLHALTPIWKVPVAEIDDQPILDSHVIIDVLLARHGWGSLAPDDPSRSIGDANVRSVIDGALDAAINLFYLVRRDGADPGLPYNRKQRDRVDSALAWIEQRVRNASLRRDGGFGLSEIMLLTTLDWMRFRDAWPVADHPALLEVLDRWRDRPSVAETTPREA